MKLADICEINPRAELLDDNTLVSFVAMPNVSEDGKINVDTHRTYGEVKKGFTNFKEGDVLFAKITPCMENGKGALATGLENGLGFGSTEFHVLRPDAAIVLGQWLYYLTSWSAFRKDAEKHMTGSAGQKRVPKSFLEKYEVDLPTIDDQNYQVLQLNRIRKIIDARQQQLSAFDDLIKARFVEMFGDETNPYQWPVVNVEDVASVSVGVVIKPAQYYTDAEHGVKAFRSLNIGAGTIKDSDWVYFSHEGNDKNSKSQLRENDLLIVRSGAPGTACVVPKIYEGCNAIDIIIARPETDKVNPHFLCTFTNLPHGKRQIDEGTGGAAQQHFNVGKYNKLQLMLPPLKKQNEFVSFLEQIDKSKSVIQKSLDETQLLFDSLMQKYFG